MGKNRQIKTQVAIGLMASCLATAASAEKVKLNMASVFPSSMVQLGSAGVDITKKIDLISGGDIKIKFFEPNALVPPLEILDAVSNGSVDAGWITTAYWGGQEPALNIFAAVPFGPDTSEFLAWMWYGDGEKLKTEIMDGLGIHGVTCGVVAPEAAGWFKKEVHSSKDFKGMRIRFYGLGGKVLQKLGADTQLIAPGDIYTALERGTIDATEFSMPAIDLDLGFYTAAKNYYFPGWHQQSTLEQLIINKKKWDKLTKRQKTIIETACHSNVANLLAEGEAIQVKALAELKSKGVNIQRWDDSILDDLRKAWTEVAAEESAKSPSFKKVWDNLQAFRKDYSTWKELGYVD